MNRRTAFWGQSAALLAMTLTCSPPSRPIPAPKHAPLEGAVARVGPVSIPIGLVAGVAAAKGIEPRAALQDVVADELLAQGAVAGELERAPEVSWKTTSALARGVSARLWRVARDAGPPTDDELCEVTVVHAVVPRMRGLAESRALFVAQSIANAVVGARSEEEFVARAKATATREVRLTVERLPPFGVDGPFLPEFVVAALRLHTPGQTSGVVETESGWHVIRLVGRALPVGVDLEVRRVALASAVDVVRARSQLAAILEARKTTTHVEVVSSAEQWMAQATAPR